MAYPLPSPQPRPQPAPRRGDDTPAPAAPPQPGAPITTILIALNVMVFVAQVALAKGGFMDPPSEVALMLGANHWFATVRELRLETLLTSCFVHGGVLHLGFNMVALRQVGPFVERAAGGARMLPLYLISGVVGAFGSTFWHIQVRPSDLYGVGASGAICGLIGTALVIGWRVQGKDGPIVRAMAGWLGTVLLIGLLPGIDGSAHLFGAVAGAVTAMLWRRGYVYSTLRRVVLYTLCAGATLGAGGLVAWHDLTDPYATMTTGARIALAEAALARRDCPIARSSSAAAQRLMPRSGEVVAIVEHVKAACP